MEPDQTYKKIHNHCETSTAVLAYAAIVYVVTCILYLAFVRLFRVGSPFTDSLSESQKRIKKKSARTRYAVFFASLFLALFLMIKTRPLAFMRKS